MKLWPDLGALIQASSGPPTSSPERLSLDPVAALARAEYIIELMDECYIAENWSPPNRADAERFLQYFRDVVQARDWCEDGEEFAFVVNFCRAHYQPLDWVLRGDVSGMIAKLARASSPHR
jgi:hypothetical protein